MGTGGDNGESLWIVLNRYCNRNLVQSLLIVCKYKGKYMLMEIHGNSNLWTVVHYGYLAIERKANAMITKPTSPKGCDNSVRGEDPRRKRSTKENPSIRG